MRRRFESLCSRMPGENGTRVQKLLKRRRTRAELAYANGHELIFAQQIALVCGRLNIIHCLLDVSTYLLTFITCEITVRVRHIHTDGSEARPQYILSVNTKVCTVSYLFGINIILTYLYR